MRNRDDFEWSRTDERLVDDPWEAVREQFNQRDPDDAYDDESDRQRENPHGHDR